MNPALPVSSTSSTTQVNEPYHDNAPRDSTDEEHTYDGTGEIENLQVRFNSDSPQAEFYTTKHNWLKPVVRYVPDPVKRTAVAIVTWIKGPNPPRQWAITPFLPHMQSIPLDMLDRWCPKQVHKISLLVAFYLIWIVTFSPFLHKSAVAQDLPGYGAPQVLWCGSSLWSVPQAISTNFC